MSSRHIITNPTLSRSSARLAFLSSLLTLGTHHGLVCVEMPDEIVCLGLLLEERSPFGYTVPHSVTGWNCSATGTVALGWYTTLPRHALHALMSLNALIPCRVPACRTTTLQRRSRCAICSVSCVQRQVSAPSERPCCLIQTTPCWHVTSRNSCARWVALRGHTKLELGLETGFDGIEHVLVDSTVAKGVGVNQGAQAKC